MAAKAMAIKTKQLRGIHVLFWISGLFAVMIAVNATFLFWALKSFPGEQVKNSYVLGLDYNSEVARRREQEKLGWTSEVGLADTSGKRLVVRMLDAGQAPLTGLAVSASVHVAGEAKAASVDLAEVSPGEYAVDMETHGGARIEALISARRAGEESAVFQAAKTLVTP